MKNAVLFSFLFVFALAPALGQAPATETPPQQAKAPEPTALEKDLTVELPGLPADAKPLTLVLIPSGEFKMGSPAAEPMRMRNEGPQFQVKIGKAFRMAQHEVTYAQFDCFVKDAGYVTEAEKGAKAFSYDAEKKAWGIVPGATWRDTKLPWPPKGNRNDHPVVMVTYADAQAFCDWLSKKTGAQFRLPSAAEWEYACRANTTTTWYWGDAVADACGHANVTGQSKRAAYGFKEDVAVFPCDSGYDGTAPVGQLKPNAFGLYDMIGNVSEWCQDWLHPSYKGAPADGSPWLEPKTDKRVIRGGSWRNPPQYCRSATQHSCAPDLAGCNLGFRVVRE